MPHFLALSNPLELPINEKKEKTQEWKRDVVHDILSEIFEPLRQGMDDGINLLCPDGHRRLCFPVLSIDMADYQELQLLTSIISGFCPKCEIPAYRHEKPEAESESTDSEGDQTEDSEEEQNGDVDTATKNRLRIKRLQERIENLKWEKKELKKANTRNTKRKKTSGTSTGHRKQNTAGTQRRTVRPQHEYECD